MIKLFLDFDGVLINSNEVKKTALLQVSNRVVGEPWGQRLVYYHAHHPGLSRFDLFAWLVKQLGHPDPDLQNLLLAELQIELEGRISSCERISRLRSLLPAKKYLPFIVSAAPQTDLEHLIREFKWAGIFQDRVFGSPATKREILTYLTTTSSESRQIFVGDSRSDLDVALECGVEFAYVSGWSSWVPDLEARSYFSFSGKTLVDIVKAIGLCQPVI